MWQNSDNITVIDRTHLNSYVEEKKTKKTLFTEYMYSRSKKVFPYFLFDGYTKSILL